MEEVVDEASERWAIVGEVDLVEADLAQALSRLPGFRRQWLLLVGMVAAILLANQFVPRWRPLLPVLLAAPFAAVLYIYLGWLTRRAWVKQTLANIGGKTTFRVDDYGFGSESSTRQHRIAWAALARTVETPEAFLVYTTPQTLLIVPKRAFTDGDVATLSRLLLERVKSKPQPAVGRVAARRMLVMWVLLIVTFLVIWRALDDSPAPVPSSPHRVH